jgi:hypothetical protein
MSVPDSSGPVATTQARPEPTPADADALFASAFWFDTHATAERVEPYRGMHVAIFQEQIIDAASGREELCRRIAARGDSLPFYRVLIRYVPGRGDRTGGAMWPASGCT